MNKLFTFYLVLLVLCLFSINNISAQESATDSASANNATSILTPINDSLFKQTFLEYNLSLEKYRKAHEEYLLRRSQYIKFKTLTSQQDAYKATLEMLIARDEVIISYLTTLRERLLIAEGVDYETKNRLDIALTLEKDWFIAHKEVLTSAETLENLVSDSNDANIRYKQTKLLVYEVFYYISDGRIEDFRLRVNSVINDLKGIKDTIKSEERLDYQFSARKIATIERFLLESENRMLRASESQSKAKEELIKLPKSSDGLSVYNSMIISLSSSQQFFKEVSSFLKEVVREIRTQEE